MRKLFAAAFAFVLSIGIAMAAEVTFVKFEDGKLTVSEGGADKSYKVGDKVKTEMFAKAKAGKTKLDITVDGETVTKVVPVKKK
jgi:opacity protein-like surface antigen